jgi:hypothetical protein
VTAEQAKDIVSLLRAATRGQVDDEKASYFEAALLHLEYDWALAAATVGLITWQYFPSWAEFKEGYRAQKRLAEPVGEQRSAEEPEYKRGIAAPEWVWVWSWCRGWSPTAARDPVEERPFPQQANYVDVTKAMTTDEYEELRDEWVSAGSPKPRSPLPV